MLKERNTFSMLSSDLRLQSLKSMMIRGIFEARFEDISSNESDETAGIPAAMGDDSSTAKMLELKQRAMKVLEKAGKKKGPFQVQNALDRYKNQTELVWPKTTAEKIGAVILAGATVGIKKEIVWSRDPPLLARFVAMLSKHSTYVARIPSPEEILGDIVMARDEYYIKQKEFLRRKEEVARAAQSLEKLRQKRVELEKSFIPLSKRVEALKKPVERLNLELKVELPKDLAALSVAENRTGVTFQDIQDALKGLHAARETYVNKLMDLKPYKNVPMDYTDAKIYLSDCEKRLAKKRAAFLSGAP